MPIRTTIFCHASIIFGLALWMSIAAFNNLNDPATNNFHLGNTLSMDLLKLDGKLGMGLIWRAWSVQWRSEVLYVVVVFQIIIAFLLWRAGFTYARAWLQCCLAMFEVARHQAVVALTCFVLLWLGFICGGLWFGYWIKQGMIQSVHLTLILIGIGALLLVQGAASPIAVKRNLNDTTATKL